MAHQMRAPSQRETPEPEFGDPVPTYVALADFMPEIEGNQQSVEFWKSLPRVPGKAPHKDDCDVLEIAELLTHCLILDLQGPTTWMVKMFGTDIVNHFGLDATGMNAYDLYAPEEQILVAKRLEVVREHSYVMYTQNLLRNPSGITIQTEWVFLPLCDDSGEVCQIIISVAAFDEPASFRDFEMDGSMNARRLLQLTYATE